MISDHYLDHLHDQRDRLENEVEMLRRAMEIALRFDREAKAQQIEAMLDRTTRELREVEDEIPPEPEYQWGVL